MNSHLIVTDLDGTLLNENHQVSPYNAKWIQSFRERGGLFTFATGRMNTTVMQFIQGLNITLPVITYNGAQMYCPVKNRVIYEQSFTLSEKMHEQLVTASKSFAEVLFFYDGDVFTMKKGELIKSYEEKEKVNCQHIAAEDLPETVTKVMLLSKNKKKLIPFEINFYQQFQNDIDLIYSETEYLEILPKRVSKGVTLQLLKEHCALTDRYTIGFGNNLNDISLLQAADLGIAVNNSVKELKDVADEVSLYTNRENAVGYYIESLLITADRNLLV